MNNKRKVSQNTPIPWQAVNSPLLKKKKRRTYTPEEKESVIKRYYDGNESVLHIMADSKIPKATIYNWIREYKKQ